MKKRGERIPMAILNIIEEGNELLRKTSRPVEEITPRILTLLDDMIETMRKADGCGLAAVQVGILRRAVLVYTDDEMIELINPVIVKTSGEQTDPEGCLSVPDVYGTVSRPFVVTVRAQDRFGKEFTITGEGLRARAFCHEIDHLDGVLFTDHVLEYLE